MRGVVFYEPGRPLSIEEFKMPRPKAGEVLIKTKGSSIFALQSSRNCYHSIIKSS